MSSEKQLNEHTIYGTWDDTYGYQFLVYWHPNGIHCSVFMLGGADYGGGITRYVDGVESKKVEEILGKHDNKNSYELYSEMSDYVYEKAKERK